MGSVRLEQMNLNLVPVLDALLIECNVTRAARRLGMTQSAVSHALSSLRDLLQDPVLVRGKTGMAPTQKAAQLAPRLRRSLEMLQYALSTVPEFDPSRAEGTLALSAPDFLVAGIGPRLIAAIAKDAPGIDLRLRELRMPHAQECLFSGETDLVIGPDIAAEGGVSSTVVLTDDFACAVRSAHPLVTRISGEGGMDLKGFLEYPHLLISPSGRGEARVDVALRELGLKRRVSVRVESFLASIPLVAGTDLILTAPRAVLSAVMNRQSASGIRMCPMPLSLPALTLRAFWDVRKEGDPRFAWFFSRVQEALDELATKLREHTVPPPPMISHNEHPCALDIQSCA